MIIRLCLLTGTFPLLREYDLIGNKKRSTIQQRYWLFDQKLKVCCLCMSAITSVCGWPRLRWPPLLPVHIHLTIESGKRKPSGECFRFPLRWARWNVLSGKAHRPRMTGHATYVSDFVSGWRFPSARRARVELCYFFYL